APSTPPCRRASWPRRQHRAVWQRALTRPARARSRRAEPSPPRAAASLDPAPGSRTERPRRDARRLPPAVALAPTAIGARRHIDAHGPARGPRPPETGRWECGARRIAAGWAHRALT